MIPAPGAPMPVPLEPGVTGSELGLTIAVSVYWDWAR